MAHPKTTLIQACKKQDAQAQKKLYDRHSALLYTIANRIARDQMQAEDIMQEVFIQFFEKSIYTLKKEESYLSFLKSAVRNKSIDCWRKKNSSIEWESMKEEPQVEEEVSQEWEWAQVLKELEQLPEKYRIMIELFYLQELSHKEISAQLNISYSNSRVLLNRAIQKLKKQCNEI